MPNTSSKNTVLVHKEGEEGVISVDRTTGRIISSLDERPDWSEGLATALVQERLDFYQKRLGDGTVYQSLSDAQAIEYSDLSWIGVDANQDEQEIEASADYRMDIVAKALGMDRETGELSGDIIAEREVSRENRGRTQGEVQALEESVKTGFGQQDDAQAAKAEGSGG